MRCLLFQCVDNSSCFQVSMETFFSSFSLFVPFPLLSVPPSFHPLFSLISFPIYSQLTNESLMANGDGIPVELFQNLKDDAVKMLHSICQQIWKTQQWPQDWKRSVFIPVPRKVNTIEHSNCWTVALISHTSKVILKILQAKLQQYMNHELPDVQVGFRKCRGTKDQTANIHWIFKKIRDFQ